MRMFLGASDQSLSRKPSCTGAASPAPTVRLRGVQGRRAGDDPALRAVHPGSGYRYALDREE